ncbi:MAG: Gfo/Idh/MocA family oxidoreductase [Anaerolineaceae bacterium]|nr:Gfo/Idh/MocA family oxidoreductase [Anaerolineaceae bacterium]
MTEKVRIALIGCGGFSRRCVQPAIEAGGLLQPVVCYDVDARAAGQAAERFGARPCDSFGEALESDGVEAVLLITPNHLHREQTEAALAAGKHVFVEKPIANTTADALAMVAAAERAGRILMVGHNTRRRAGIRLAQQWVNEGRVGQLVGCAGQFSGDTGLSMGEEVWRADPDRCPGLPLMQLGIHLIDVMNMLLGRPRRVAAFHRRAVLRRNDDCTVSIIAYDEPLTATLASHYVVQPAINELTIMGTEGVIEVTRRHRHVVLLDSKDNVIESREIADETSYANEFRAFGDAITSGAAVETDGMVGLYALAVVEASIISAREDRLVGIDALLDR